MIDLLKSLVIVFVMTVVLVSCVAFIHWDLSIYNISLWTTNTRAIVVSLYFAVSFVGWSLY